MIDLNVFTNLKLGDKIIVTDRLVKTSPNLKVVKWGEISITPTKVMFLGFTNIYDGEISYGCSDYDIGYMESNSFFQTKTHRVLVVQPIQGTRYRKPFYILSPKQKKGYWPTAESFTKEQTEEKRLEEILKDIKNVLGI